jgi:hypothetical protein
VSRIGHITVAAILLAAAGWAIVYWPSGFFENRARNALVARGTEILRQNKSNSAIVPLRDLFGDDIDGVCVVWNGPVAEDEMQGRSPAKFSPVIAAIAKMQAGEDIADGDTRYWIIHTAKGGAVLRTYSLAIRANLDMLRTDEAEDRCFDRNVAAQLTLYSATVGEDRTLIVKVPAVPPATAQ